MDYNIFGEKVSHHQKPRDDRFVLSRESVEMHKQLKRRNTADLEPIDIWDVKQQRQRKYKAYLDKALGLPQMPRKITSQPWPCRAREGPCLTSADSILDLPSYSYAQFQDLLDWSHTNILVAGLGRQYHMFSWHDQKVIWKGTARHSIQCCKFDPQGELLLVGTEMNVVEVHSSRWGFSVDSGRCDCSKNGQYCSVTALNWSATGQTFAAGCSRGVVTVFDRFARHITNWRGLSQTPVFSVNISPDTRYVAVNNLRSPAVHVLTWPSLDYICTLNAYALVKSIAWHPWRSALLGVGAVNKHHQSSIAMWNIPSSHLRELAFQNQYITDALLFSHRTGELVLALWKSNFVPESNHMRAQLVVMSDPETVVDQSGESRVGLDRVKTMVFSPDGSKLATATADEDLIIWNFLPEDKSIPKKKITKSRKFSAIPAYMDLTTKGFVLR